MRREINLIHNNTLRSKCHTLVEKTEGKIRQGFSAVKKMKDNLIQSAGNAVRAFRERGRDALAESVRAMKIPEALDKLSAMFGRMSKEMAQDTKKLSAMQAELQGAKGHLKNMGLLFMGKAAKEAEHSKSDKGVLSRLSRLFEKAQKGFASLEQKAMDTADKLRVSRVKSSVKENLSRYRAAAKAEKPAKPKKETSPRKKAKLTLNIICTMLRGAGRLTRAIFGALRFTKIRICLGVRGEDPAQAARTYGKLNAWLYTSLGVLDRFLFLDFEELRLLPDFGSAEPTVEDRVSFRVSARLFFIVCAAVRVLYEFWREKVLDVFI